jgi:hypothetical protein
VQEAGHARETNFPTHRRIQRAKHARETNFRRIQRAKHARETNFRRIQRAIPEGLYPTAKKKCPISKRRESVSNCCLTLTQ